MWFFCYRCQAFSLLHAWWTGAAGPIGRCAICAKFANPCHTRHYDQIARQPGEK